MTVQVKGKQELGARLKSMKYLPEKVLTAWQMRTVELAKRKVARKTRILMNSIHKGTRTKTFAQVEASASYAAYVEFGTKPHIIKPKYAKVLAWNNQGSVGNRQTGSVRSGAKPNVFARQVHHPGTKAQPFLLPSAKAAQDEVKLTQSVVDLWNGGA